MNRTNNTVENPQVASARSRLEGRFTLNSSATAKLTPHNKPQTCGERVLLRPEVPCTNTTGAVYFETNVKRGHPKRKYLCTGCGHTENEQVYTVGL